jgi:hypothetical protein
MVHGVECDPAKLSGPVGRFVRANPVLVSQDINQYDSGLFNIAVCETGYANQSMGELWVSYTVELRKPKFFVNRGLGISRDVFITRGMDVTGGTNQQYAFGTAGVDYPLRGQQNNIGCTLQGFLSNGIPATARGVWSTGTAGTLLDQTARLIFPANYAGNVRVTFTLNSALAGPGTTYTAFVSGNVFRINDDINNSTMFTEAGVCTRMIEGSLVGWADLRVQTASNGQDNCFYLHLSGAWPQLQDGHTRRVRVQHRTQLPSGWQQRCTHPRQQQRNHRCITFALFQGFSV